MNGSITFLARRVSKLTSDDDERAPIDWGLYSFDLVGEELAVFEGGREIGRADPFPDGRPTSALLRLHCCRRAAREVIERRGELAGIAAGSLF